MLFSQQWLERMNGMTTKHIEAFWVNATADDVARVMAGETVEARFRNSKKHEWENGNLRGWSQVEQDKRFWDQRAYQWLKCQVYREPSWYANKPEPGPGFRLLDKFPDEELKPGDELWYKEDELWGISNNAHHDMAQGPGCWYRRRIEVVEPEPKHYVLRVGDSVESPSGDRIKCVEPSVEQRHYKLRATDTISTPNGLTITITEKGFEVTQ
jgi:hypothetical protein